MDEDREALVEALRGAWASGVPFEPGGAVRFDRFADTLLPVVDAIARRRAAEELRRAADGLRDADGWITGRVLDVHDALHARANALEAL